MAIRDHMEDTRFDYLVGAGVRYLNGYPKFEITQTKVRAQLGFLIDEFYVINFLNFLASLPADWDSWSWIRINDQFPLANHLPLYATSYTIQPLSRNLPGNVFLADPQTAPYDAAELGGGIYEHIYQVVVDFEPTVHSLTGGSVDTISPEEFLHPRTIQAGGQILNIPPQSLIAKEGEDTDNDDGEPLTQFSASVQVVTPQIDHTWTWDNVPSPRWLQFYENLGKVNDGEVHWLRGNPEVPGATDFAQRDTLLFLGVTAKPTYKWKFKVSDNAQQYWTIDFKFSQRDFLFEDDEYGRTNVTWQHVYRPSTQRYEYVTRNDNGDPLYNRFDIQTLFRS